MNLDLQKVLPAEAFETEQNEGDYIGKDGLLYCGVCRTKKQTRLPASDFTGGREIIVPCICKCKVEENKRKEEEEKKRQEMQRLERLKASSLMDAKLKAARLDGYQVDGDNQKIYNLAGNYVKRFDEMYEKRQGLLFWGLVGTGKSYTAACIANELLNQMIPVVMTSFVKILQNIQGKEFVKGVTVGEATAEENTQPAVSTVETNEEETKQVIRANEEDFIAGLIAAADFASDEEETQRIEIFRNGKLAFAFSIRPLGSEEYDKCRKKFTKYVRNKQLGIKMPEDTDRIKYQSAIIHKATIAEDRDKLSDLDNIKELQQNMD